MNNSPALQHALNAVAGNANVIPIRIGAIPAKPENYSAKVAEMMEDAKTLYETNKGTPLEKGWRGVWIAYLDLYAASLKAENAITER